MKEIIKRWTAESPAFFKKIIFLGITLGAIGTAIMTTPVETFDFPEWLDKIAGHLVGIGAIAAIIAKFTVADTSVLKKEETK